MSKEKSPEKELESLRAEALKLEKAIHRVVEETETSLELLKEDAGRVYEYSKGELGADDLGDALLWIAAVCEDMIEEYTKLKEMAEKLFMKAPITWLEEARGEGRKNEKPA